MNPRQPRITPDPMLDQALTSDPSQSRQLAAAREQFTSLLDCHIGIVRKVAAAYAADGSEREDLIQEIGLQLWRAWPKYDAGRPFSTWMYRIALNVGISFLRSRSRGRASVRSLDELPVEPSEKHRHDPELEEGIRVIRRALSELQPLDRALLILHFDDRSHREIGEVLGLSESNVGSKLARLKERMRRTMTDELGTGATP